MTRSGDLARVKRESIHEPSAQGHTRKATRIAPGGFLPHNVFFFKKTLCTLQSHPRHKKIHANGVGPGLGKWLKRSELHINNIYSITVFYAVKSFPQLIHRSDTCQ